MRRRTIGLILVVSLISALVAGCESFLVATPAPVTITFAHSGDTSAVLEQWAQQFHQLHPHITIELTEDLQASGVDAFLASQFALSEDLAANVLDLSVFIEQSNDLDMADFYPAAVNVFKSQGRQRALPFSMDMMVMFYNRDVFDRYGVSYPEIGWTWNDFLDRALDLTYPSESIYGYAMQYSNDFGIYEPLMMIYQFGGGIFDSLVTPTRATLDNPLNIEAMGFYAGLIHVHRVAPTQAEAERSGRMYPWGGIFDGRFAMWSMMYSQRGGTQWPTPWRMDWGMVPMPRGASSGTLTVVDGLYIVSGTDHPMEAWQWIEYVSAQRPPFAMPARIALAESQQFEQIVGAPIAEAARAAVADAILVNPQLLGFESALAAFGEALEQIRSGEVTPEIALAAAQRKAES